MSNQKQLLNSTLRTQNSSIPKMPIIESSYKAKHIWKNPHFSTIYPSTLRKVEGVHYTRERIELPDGDFWIWIGVKVLFQANRWSYLHMDFWATLHDLYFGSGKIV
jgi:predicted alpha/beta-fold hydrolase